MFFSITAYNFLTTGSKASVFHFCLSPLYSYALPLQSVPQKPCQGNFGKFQGSGESRLGGSEKDCNFLKISKWRDKLVWDNKGGKFFSYFLYFAAKTCLYGLKILENIEIEH